METNSSLVARGREDEHRPRQVTDNDVSAVIDTYRAHTFSLLLPILRVAITTPSSLWIRGALIPVFAAFVTYQPNSIAPYIVGCIALLLVPLLVGVFVLLQLHLLARRATETDLNEKLPFHFSDNGSRFFVVSEDERVLGCVGVRSKTGGQAELVYLAVRPKLPHAAAVADSLLAAALTHARRSGFKELVLRLNSAEAGLLQAAQRAGLGGAQMIRINAWFHAVRLTSNLKRGR